MENNFDYENEDDLIHQEPFADNSAEDTPHNLQNEPETKEKAKRRKVKIDFRQPKFVLPLIILPFIAFGYYMWHSAQVKKEKMAAEAAAQTEPTDMINPHMPSVSQEVDTTSLASKFKLAAQGYRGQKELTELEPLTPDAPPTSPAEYASGYTPAERQRLLNQQQGSSLDELIKQNAAIQQQADSRQLQAEQNFNNYKGGNTNSTHTPEEIIKDARERYGKQQSLSSDLSSPSTTQTDPYEESMRAFRDQMHIMDSMQNPQQYAKKAAPKNPPVEDEKPLPVKMLNEMQTGFNTVRRKTSSTGIMAVIDQDQQGTAGTRVRIKLLKDVYVGNNYIPKGTSIYGFITGFQTSRVNISIDQIMYNGTPLRVNLDVFDNDGYLGLYVPGSNFREFTKELGTQSSQGLGEFQMSTGETQNNSITQSLISKVLTTSGQSLSKIISQNKVKIKYNYIIYLRESKQGNEDQKSQLPSQNISRLDN